MGYGRGCIEHRRMVDGGGRVGGRVGGREGGREESSIGILF